MLELLSMRKGQILFVLGLRSETKANIFICIHGCSIIIPTDDVLNFDDRSRKKKVKLVLWRGHRSIILEALRVKLRAYSTNMS